MIQLFKRMMEGYNLPNITIEDNAKYYRIESKIKLNEIDIAKFRIFQDTEDFIVTMKLSKWEKELSFDFNGCSRDALNETMTLMMRYFNNIETMRYGDV